jgi:hypothetical protein
MAADGHTPPSRLVYLMRQIGQHDCITKRMSKRSLKTKHNRPDVEDDMNTLGPCATSVELLDEQAVAELAYRRWVDRGCPLGCPEDGWYEAERELRSQRNTS